MSDSMTEAQGLAELIAVRYHPQKIILFGSVARGQAREDSDIDLLIVQKSDKKKAYRIKDVFEAVRGAERHYPLDPLVYTPEELDKRITLGDHFIKRILSEGKVVYAG